MRFVPKNMIRIIVLSIFLLTLFNAPFMNFTQNYRNSRSSTPILAPSANHSPIIINGNTDFITQASTENWSGGGTFSDPYVIDSLTISGPTTSVLISIYNTDVHFQIKNCVLSGGENGLRCENVQNAQVINCIVRNNVVDGISFLGNSKNILLENNSVSNNYWDGIYVTDECEDFTVLNNTITGNRYGVNTRGDNLTIKENYITDNLHAGISLGGSLNQLVDNRIIDNGVGIMFGGNNNSGMNNIVKNNREEGIRLSGSFNTVAKNIITNNSLDGIGLIFAGNSTIVNNILENNEFRIQAIDWDGLPGTTDPRFEDYIQEEIKNNTINGRQLIYWKNRIGGAVPSGTGQVILVNCSSITVENQILSGGIDVVHSSHLWISNNTIPSRIGPGIRIISSNSCSLIGNTIMNITGGALLSSYGIRIVESMNCTVASNMIINNEGSGIYLQNSCNNTLQGNKVTNNSKGGITITTKWEGWGNPTPHSINNRLIDNILEKNGLQIFPFKAFMQNEIANNTINGKPLLVWQNKTGATVPDNVGQVILFNCPSTRIIGQKLAGILALNSPSLFIHNNMISDGWGIFLNATDNSILSENTVVNNYGTGIDLEFSGNCTLMNNTVSNNVGDGIDLFICTNCILKTNFINNNTHHGINLVNSENLLVTNNTLTNNDQYAMFLSYTSVKVFYNNFINNGNPEFYQSTWANSQASDGHLGNLYFYNYWSEWITPDIDADGIVDNPYILDGSGEIQDNHPLVSPVSVQGHLLLPPTIIYPNGGENLYNTVILYWNSAIDISDHPISYSVYYSPDNGNNWELIASNLISTSFSWDTSSLPPLTTYLIKVVAQCSEGLTTEDISDGTFRIVNFITESSSSSSDHSAFGFTLISIFTVLPVIIRKKLNQDKRSKVFE